MIGDDFRPYYDRRGNPIDGDEAAVLMADIEARRVALDTFLDGDVSTVHLVLNHQFDDGPPLIFETMIFGGTYDGYQWRWPTEEEAVEGHRQVVAWLKGEGAQPS